ncbi:MAG TPA: TIGR02646 family protein [Candidatus Rifleibacterium sp.]|nr:TIGR02646 family protein [Candidatus Rifleibacterium sp.]HPT48208.1 TIGR02646 family protein [Candidatus Rifleibacterium sp.]
MHRLNRGPEPACLRHYRITGAKWEDIEPNDKTAIQKQLFDIQGYFCAYCEASIKNSDNRHIEHFRKKENHSAKIFEWGNLFWSCCNPNCCGFHKDSSATGSYSPDDLIKPDEEDSDDYFLFLATGNIVVRTGLPENMRRRAEETLRVFNLNGKNSGLIARRRIVAKNYRESLEALMQIECSATAKITEYIGQLLEAARNAEFYTTVKHVLTLQGEPA